ncbi:DNA binding protein, putative [Ricinus communis]|uniref:DNA binding protein, putative n=1 Tax=Ricinus communis TaxID=3988 RepID=B9STH6_RICCO|nr:DNA binding protein, putative [Ricinus communis]|eukprot:XP_002529295.1 transcription factor bHLH104 [Ricinus communis]
MDSLEEGSCWDFLDYSFIEETTTSSDLLWPNSNNNLSEIDFSSSGGAVSEEKQCSRKRARGDSCSKPVTKACREKLRRERLNDRFQDLSSVLEPERPARTDKPSLLDDAIRVLNQLKTEAQELKETNEKLLEEIKCLKAEKNELREEKLTLKADKERTEQQLKIMAVRPPGYMPAHPAAYHAAMNKMAIYPSFGLIPMWQLPPAAQDTSKDHEYWPPAA